MRDNSSLSDSGNLRYLVLDAIRAVGSGKLGMVRSALIDKRFNESIGEDVTTDEYEVRFLTSYK